MKIKELVEKGLIPKDHWLTKAQVLNESIKLKGSKIIWKNGVWENGVWESGIWKKGTWVNGTWKDGTWKDGTWKNGVWKRGIWESGTWNNGNWYRGIWENGAWENGTWYNGLWKEGTWKNGIWENGIWEGGIWKDGTWKGGNWYRGLWKDGTWENGTWYKGLWYKGVWEKGWEPFGRNRWFTFIDRKQKLLKVGCEKKTIGEWEEWLRSDKVFHTRRDSPEFEFIKETILEAIEILKVKTKVRDELKTFIVFSHYEDSEVFFYKEKDLKEVLRKFIKEHVFLKELDEIQEVLLDYSDIFTCDSVKIDREEVKHALINLLKE